MTTDKGLTILGHLRELRDRLTRSVIAIAVATIISFIFAGKLFDLLTYKSPLDKAVFDVLVGRFHLAPAPNVNLVFIETTEMLGTYMKVCLVAGVILAIPYLLYQLIMFVSPGLTNREERYVRIALPWISFMFIFGVLFAYFILLPPALAFLFDFGTDIATPQIRVGNYIGLMTRMLLAIGLVFELPVMVTLLARIGVVTPKWLAKRRRLALVGAFVLGAIITPTMDPVNQTLVALPLIVLYELSILLAKLAYKRRLAHADAAA